MRWNHVFLLISLMFFECGSWAANDRVCERLSGLNCSPGKLDDGTGPAVELLASGEMPQDKVAADYKRRLKAKLVAELSRPEAHFNRQLALSATGLSDRGGPPCEGAEKSGAPSSECVELLANGAVEIFARVKVGDLKEFDPALAEASLRDKALLLASPKFSEAAAEAHGEAIRVMEELPISKKLPTIFDEVQKLMLERIDKLPAPDDIKEKMRTKVGAVQFKSLKCQESGSAATLSDLLTVNASYFPTSRNVKMCAMFLEHNQSEFNAAFVLAHELAHSIDPCEITMGPSAYSFQYPVGGVEVAEEAYPVEGLIRCLRSAQSVAAIPLEERWDANRSYDSSEERHSFCGLRDGSGDDQITEATPDWMAAEVLPMYIQKHWPKLTPGQIRNGYANISRGMSESRCYAASTKTAPSTHPSWDKRLDRLVLAQPQIRAQMDCPAPVPEGTRYCSAESAEGKSDARVRGKKLSITPTSPRTIKPVESQGGPNVPPPATN